MAFFRRFKQTIIQAKIATELETVLDSYTGHHPLKMSNSKLASDLVSETCEQLITQLGKLTGTRSEMYTVILSSLARLPLKEELADQERHLALVVFGDLYSQLKSTNFSGFTRIELALIEEARESVGMSSD